MDTRHVLLRGTAALSLAVMVVGSAVLTPSASAAPLPGSVDFHATANKPKKDSGKSEEEGSSGGGGIGDLPIIGDVVNDVKNDPPEEIVGEVAGFLQTAIPLVRSYLKP
jgi:hypothetical protein